LSKSRADGVAAVVDEGIANGAFPGVVVMVEKKGKLVFSLVRGDRQVQPAREPMTSDTLFDLASLTKPLATAPLVLLVAAREGIDLDSVLGRFLPGVCPESGALTLRQLLLHTGGLPPVPDLYKAFPDATAVDREAAERLLLSRRPERAPGTEVVYSCTGYQLLGLWLRRMTGKRLSQLFASLAAPAGLARDLLFNPPDPGRCAATELCGWRKRWIRGEVHDENSWCLGGDAGNAGLFGTAAAVLRRLDVLAADDLFAPMRRSFTDGLNRRRAVGFMMHDAEAPVGPLYGSDSFGHTGFTGTSVWVEPPSQLRVVALTNRVHFGRAETQPKLQAFRLALHQAVRREWA
jgi:CubicO group peptidase (beta-lactamase class C family)